MKTVCAVIVTYNRKNYLLNLLDALQLQSYKINKVVIFDNYSSDGTDVALLQAGYISELVTGRIITREVSNIDYVYFKNEENSGGSGGFHGGLKIAEIMKTDYIWAMDDDVLPEKDCLEKLIKNISAEARICIPSRTDDLFLDSAIIKMNMTNPFIYHYTSWKTLVPSNQLNNEVTTVVDMPFEGPLFETSLIQEIGLPNKDLFILFDDTEYAYRASQKTKIQYIKSAILHKQIIPQDNYQEKMSWKSYYSFRNQCWFDRTYGKNIAVKKIRPLFRMILTYLKAASKQRWADFRVIKKAHYDGMHGNMGKTIDPANDIFS